MPKGGLMPKKGVHVVPSGGKWLVKKEGSASATSSHRTQAAASKMGRTVAKQDKTELFVHGRDGRIRERNSYGNDPRGSKG